MTSKPRAQQVYPLPSDLEPVGTRTVQVCIPDDPEWLAVFADHVERLTWSAMHARDETRIGAATVARVWEQALAACPIETVEPGGPMLQVRTNPANPCEIQYSVNEGQTWVTFHSDDDCIAPNTPYTPYPPNTVGAGEGSAGNFAQYINDLTCIAVAGIDNGDSDAQIIAAMQQHLTSWNITGVSNTPLQDIIDGLRALTPAERAAYCDGQLPYDVGIGAVCAGVVNMRDGHWLDVAANWIGSTLNGWSQWLVDSLTTVASAISLDHQDAISGAYGGGGGGAGFGTPEECFHLIWNFYAGTPPFPWTIEANHVSSAGSFTPTVGYVATYGAEADPPDYSKGTSIKLRLVNDVRLTYYRVDYYLDRITTGDASATCLYILGQGEVEIPWNSTPEGYQNYIIDNPRGDPTKLLNVSLRPAYMQDIGTGHIRRIEIRGIGKVQYA